METNRCTVGVIDTYIRFNFYALSCYVKLSLLTVYALSFQQQALMEFSKTTAVSFDNCES